MNAVVLYIKTIKNRKKAILKVAWYCNLPDFNYHCRQS